MCNIFAALIHWLLQSVQILSKCSHRLNRCTRNVAAPGMWRELTADWRMCSQWESSIYTVSSFDESSILYHCSILVFVNVFVLEVTSFTYYEITKGEGGGLQMITIRVIVSNSTTVYVITGGGGGRRVGWGKMAKYWLRNMWTSLFFDEVKSVFDRG